MRLENRSFHYDAEGGRYEETDYFDALLHVVDGLRGSFSF